MSVANKVPLEVTSSPRTTAEFTIKLTPFAERAEEFLGQLPESPKCEPPRSR